MEKFACVSLDFKVLTWHFGTRVVLKSEIAKNVHADVARIGTFSIFSPPLELDYM